MILRFIATTTIIALILQITTLDHISIDLPEPIYSTFKNPLTSYTVEDGKIMSVNFSNINYEISMELFMEAGTMSDDQLFDKSAYSQQASLYCQTYSTTTQTLQRSTTPLPHPSPPLKHLLSPSASQSHLYLLFPNSILYRYQLDKISIKLKQQYPIDSSITHIVDGQMVHNVEIVEIGGRVVVVGWDRAAVVDFGDVLAHVGDIGGYLGYGHEANGTQIGSGSGEIVGVGVIGEDLLWVCYDTGLDIYQIVFNESGRYKAQMTVRSSYPNLTTNPITSITYDNTTHEFHILSSNKLTILLHLPTPDPNPNPHPSPITSTHNINGNCERVRKIGNTLYVMCQYQKINFVMEVLMNRNGTTNGGGDGVNGVSVPVLNRYYDQSLLEGIRDVQSLGYDKILLIGDQQVLLIGQAVNRNTLLDLQKRRKQQNYEVMSSFGLITLYYLPPYSTQLQSTILLITTESITTISLIYDAPQLQCILSRQDLGPSVSLLLVFNTTHCPRPITQTQYEDGENGGPLTVCQVYFPIGVSVAVKEYQQKSAWFILFLVVVFGGALIVVCVGFGIQVRRRANQAILTIQQKIQKLQKAGKKKRNPQKI